MSNSKIKYFIGDLFLIKLENKEQILGLITKRRNRTKILLGYFWKLQAPDFVLPISLGMENAFFTARFSALRIESGTWIHLGKYSKWNASDWLVPTFSSFDQQRKSYYKVFYDDNLIETERVTISENEANSLCIDGLHGAKFLEDYLILKINNQHTIF